jgi:nicotinate-nucleotide pyrophosphorylase (carboxylating)
MQEQRALEALWSNHLQEALRADGWPFDWTARSILPRKRVSESIEVVAKSEGVWGAPGLIEAMRRLSREMGSEIQIESHIQSGQEFHGGNSLMVWSGSAETILQLERPFLNLAAYASGVATATWRLVNEVKKAAAKNGIAHPPRVAGTRKILPYYHRISVEAMMAGGGHPHRPGLSSGVLIKENHIRAGGGIAAVIDRCRREAPHSHRIEIEVTTQEEAIEAVDAGAEVLMLDNFSTDRAKAAIPEIRKKNPKIWIEMSGGIQRSNIQDFVIEGVDIISVGSITHSVMASDFTLLFPKGE